MFSYYLELLNKPVYLLSESERFFIDIFPLLFLGIVSVIVYIIAVIVDVVKNKNKRK